MSAARQPKREETLPRISVVTPSLNQGPFIEGNIASVLDQDYPDFEQIVVDGVSTDDTLDILRRHEHIRWVSEKDRNMTEALNKGFRMATGDIIAWLNTDDRYRPGAFHTAARHLAPGTGHRIILGDALYIDRTRGADRVVRGHPFETEDLLRFWQTPHFLCQPAVFFHRALFDELGYLDETLDWSMDFEFFLRVSQHYRFHYVPGTLCEVIKHREAKTAPDNLHVVHREMLEVSKRFWGPPGSPSWLNRWSSFHSERALQAAYRLHRDGRPGAALAQLASAKIYRPWIVFRPTWWSILARTSGLSRFVDAVKGAGHGE